MLLSLSTFLSSLPNSLPKEKGTSNASLCPQSSALTDLATDVSGLDHRGGKIGFADTLSLAFWDNKRQRYIRDGMERFLPAILGLPNAINKTEQRGGCWFCGGWAWCTAGFLKGNRGEKLIELWGRVCVTFTTVWTPTLFYAYILLYMSLQPEWLLLMDKLMLSVPFRSSRQSFLIFHQSLQKKKNTFAGLHYFQAAGTVSNSSIFKGVEPSQGVVKLHHPFSNNHIHTFSEVLCSARHHKSKCPEARRNWLCCRFLDFLVPERGISYPGLSTRTQSPVGEKKYGLSWLNVIYVVRINKYFLLNQSYLPWFL